MAQPAGTLRDGLGGQVRDAARPQLVCTVSGGYFKALNGEWQRLLGWTKEELKSRPLADFVHPGDRERSLRTAVHVTKPGFTVTNFENRFRARDGVWRWLRWTARADGSRWVAAAVDVTDEKRAEALARPSAAAGPVRRANATSVVEGELAALATPQGPVVPTPAPAVAVTPPGGDRLRRIAWGVAIVLAAVVLAIAAVKLVGGDSGARRQAPVALAHPLPVSMSGPVDGAGSVLGPALGEPAPPDMFGPRPARGS